MIIMGMVFSEGSAFTPQSLKKAGGRSSFHTSLTHKLSRDFSSRFTVPRALAMACVVFCLVSTGCSPAILSVDGLVLVNGQQSILLAQLEREPVLGFRSGIENRWVRFFVGGRQVAQELTADEGRASTSCDLSPAVGAKFAVTAVVDGRTMRTAGTIFDWRDDRTIIAVDIDGTISDTDYDDLVFDDEDKDSVPIANSRETLSVLANDYHIVYFTARPRFLLEKTRGWLAKHGYPHGPVVAAGGLRDSLRQGSFKREMLVGLRQSWPNLLIGIGDKHRDAVAYRANGMLPVVLTTKNIARKRRTWQVTVLSTWEDVSLLFAANPRILSAPSTLADAIDSHRAHSMLAIPPEVSLYATEER